MVRTAAQVKACKAKAKSVRRVVAKSSKPSAFPAQLPVNLQRPLPVGVQRPADIAPRQDDADSRPSSSAGSNPRRRLSKKGPGELSGPEPGLSSVASQTSQLKDSEKSQRAASSASLKSTSVTQSGDSKPLAPGVYIRSRPLSCITVDEKVSSKDADHELEVAKGRRVVLKASHFRKYGHSEGCWGCENIHDAFTSKSFAVELHTPECRKRIEGLVLMAAERKEARKEDQALAKLQAEQAEEERVEDQILAKLQAEQGKATDEITGAVERTEGESPNGEVGSRRTHRSSGGARSSSDPWNIEQASKVDKEEGQAEDEKEKASRREMKRPRHTKSSPFDAEVASSHGLAARHSARPRMAGWFCRQAGNSQKRQALFSRSTQPFPDVSRRLGDPQLATDWQLQMCHSAGHGVEHFGFDPELRQQKAAEEKATAAEAKVRAEANAKANAKAAAEKAEAAEAKIRAEANAKAAAGQAKAAAEKAEEAKEQAKAAAEKAEAAKEQAKAAVEQARTFDLFPDARGAAKSSGRADPAMANGSVCLAADSAHSSNAATGEVPRKTALRKRPNAMPCRIVSFSSDEEPDLSSSPCDTSHPSRESSQLAGSRGQSKPSYPLYAKPKMAIAKKPPQGTISTAQAAGSVPAVSESAARDQLCEELLKMQMDGGCKALTASKAEVPMDGRFASLDHYIQIWTEFVIEEAKSQLTSKLSAMPRSGGLIDVQPQAGESANLVLLTGCWRANRDAMTIKWTPAGLWVNEPRLGWSFIGPPTAGDWRRVDASGKEVWLRLSQMDWNVLEVVDGQQRTNFRRGPSELRPSSVVLVVTTKSGEPVSPVGAGLVKTKFGEASLRLSEHTSQAIAHESDVGAFITDLNTTVSAREMSAIAAVQNLHLTLRCQLLGENAPRGSQVRHASEQLCDRPLPCLDKLNASQAMAVKKAADATARGFKLIWGPPGTGKSTTLVALINALHVREYEKMHRMLETLVLERDKFNEEQAKSKWAAAIKNAPRILITASSNSAVENLLTRVQDRKFLDRMGNVYSPWSIIRIGVPNRGAEVDPHDLDFRVKELLRMPASQVDSQLREVRVKLRECQKHVAKLQKEVALLQSAMPLRAGWGMTLKGGKILYHNHADGPRRYATFQRPPDPENGSGLQNVLDIPAAIQTIGQLFSCAEQWWQLEGEEERLAMLRQSSGNVGPLLQTKLESSFIARAHLVFVTLSMAAKLQRYSSLCKNFGAVVVDEAAQATEPAALVPLHAANTDLCVLVGDDRQLPPTLFSPQASHGLASVTLFERLRHLGHSADMLKQQFRMAPAISAFPRKYFYENQLQDSAAVESSTRRRVHKVLPPLLFLSLGSSRASQASGSWHNPQEVRLCVAMLDWISQAALHVGEEHLLKDVGVITPYLAQKEALQRELAKPHVKWHQWPQKLVNTIDAFQGQECEVIIFNAVRAPEHAAGSAGAHGKIGFLADERRLNVALTRAKSLLVVVGHAPTLAQSHAWAALIKHAKENKCFYGLPQPEAFTSVFGSPYEPTVLSQDSPQAPSQCPTSEPPKKMRKPEQPNHPPPSAVQCSPDQPSCPLTPFPEQKPIESMKPGDNLCQSDDKPLGIQEFAEDHYRHDAATATDAASGLDDCDSGSDSWENMEALDELDVQHEPEVAGLTDEPELSDNDDIMEDEMHAETDPYLV